MTGINLLEFFRAIMQNLRRLIMLSLVAFIVGSGFGPWVYRAPVALQLTLPGLAEYVKFLPEVRFGELQFDRLYFLLPPAIAAFTASLIAVNGRLQLHPAANIFLRLSVIPLALNLLSPIWAPERLINDEFLLQTIVAGAAIGAAVLAVIFKKLPLKLVLPLVAGAVLVAVYLALALFYRVNEAIAATYAGTILLGWGGWLTLLGGVGLVVSAVRVWLVPNN